MKVGFTGTQRGMTEAQSGRVAELLVQLGATEFHHGDCVGADHQAHVLARLWGARIVVHPPEDPGRRAWCVGDFRWPTAPYLERNHEIVDSVGVVIATPGEAAEQQRSGTWATIRYARKVHVPVIVIPPDGGIPRASAKNGLNSL